MIDKALDNLGYDLFLFERTEKNDLIRTVGPCEGKYQTNILSGVRPLDKWSIVYQRKYNTKEEAREGHNQILEEYKYDPYKFRNRITPLVEA